MNKKGEVAFVLTFMVAVLAALLLLYLLFPQVKSTTRTALANEEYTHAGADNNLTLDSYPVVSGSFSAENLTEGLNYSVLDYNTGRVRFNNTAAATYTLAYTYKPTNYLDNTSERALMAMVGLAGMLGLAYWLLKVFGLVGE